MSKLGFMLMLLVLPFSFLVWDGGEGALAFHVYYRDGFDTSGWTLEAKVANRNYVLSDEDKKQPQRFWTVASIGADGLDYPTVNLAIATNWQRTTFTKLVSPHFRQ